MAISHIPAHVGHNFVPEYQISSVIYSTSTSRPSDLSFVVVQKQRTINGNDDQDTYREVGFALAEAGVTAVTLTVADTDTTPLTVFGDAGGEVPNAATVANLTDNYVLVRKLSLPKISNWIQLETVGASRIIYFSKKDVINHQNFIRLDAGEKTAPLKLRLTDLYFRNSTLDAAAVDNDQNLGDGEHIKIISGLTVINRNEFKDTIETFLGDNK